MKALKLLVITTLFAWAGLAQAGTACPGSYDDNVLLTPTGTTEAQCETGSQNNDSPQPAQVNDDAMFTYTNWMTILKDDTTGDGFSFPDTGIGGTGAL